MKLGTAEAAADVPVISTGSLGLDIALGIGGIPRGRVVEIFGPESSGKTTLTLHAIAEAQKAGGVAAFIDAEHALDLGYARKLGVQTTICSCRNRIRVNRRWKLPRPWSGAAPSISSWSIPVAALVPRAEIEGRWAMRIWAYRLVSCLRPCEN